MLKMRILYNDMRKIIRNVAICMELNDFIEHGIARGIVRYAKQQNLWKLYGYGWMFRPLKDIEYWEGDGIIARIESQEDADRFASLKVPIVDVAGAYDRKGICRVLNDDKKTGAIAGGYLKKCGFKTAAFLGAADTGWSGKRKQGFAGAYGLREKELRIFEKPLTWWEELVQSNELSAWIENLPFPLGIFACNDTAGVKFTEQCRLLNIPVPGSAAILGVDNEDILCELSWPSLSSIRLDSEKIGYEAASLLDTLFQQEKGGSYSQYEVIIPPGEISERESTRIFACDDPIVQKAVTFIRNNAQEGIQVSDVAEYAAASRRNLEKRFKHIMGKTPYEEIVHTRIEYAKNLLRRPEKTVAAVAEESGFGSLQRFHAQFKSCTGSSPGKFRKIILGR